MPFDLCLTDIPDVKLIDPKFCGDSRGFFLEVFKVSEFIDAGMTGPIVQINHSLSSQGVLRGLHYQMNPMAQGKLVRIIKGEILDVAVDIRKGSPHYGKWIGVRLSDANRKMLFIPPGFAHGFCVLSDEAEMVYYITVSEYAPAHDRGIFWNDPAIGIDWPVKEPLLSDKDRRQPLLKDAENNFLYMI
jgi:dTDP-4-dehydrorhamnose 3,5-epimerase